MDGLSTLVPSEMVLKENTEETFSGLAEFQAVPFTVHYTFQEGKAQGSFYQFLDSG